MEFQKMIELYHLGRNILLHGPAGTGKTKCIKDFISMLDTLEGVNYQILAPTGTAACNIQGMTIQSYFQLSTTDDKLPLRQRINTQIGRSRYTNDGVTLLIIDEISMVGDELIMVMDNILKKFYDRSKPFGGVQCIVSGDFYQLSPVKQDWCFKTDIWKYMKFFVVPFEDQKRYSCDRTFKLLNRLRLGRLTPLDKSWFRERMAAYKNGEYKNLPIQPIELYANSRDVKRINDINMAKIDSPEITIESIDEVKPPNFGNQNRYLNELADKYCILKVGIPIIFYRNYNIGEGLTNGTAGKVISIDADEKKVVVETASGVHEITPKRYTITGKGWSISRTQIPIVPGWAMTQAKAQGSTLSHAIVDLNCVYDGQFYTTVSRVVSIDNLFINYKSIKVSQAVVDWMEDLGI